MSIELQNVSKEFNNQYAVNNLSLIIPKGEIIGLLGGNGAGKTTTLKMIAGVLTPNSGLILINGKNGHGNRQDVIRQMGFLTRGMALYDRFTVYENLDLLGKLRKMNEKEIQYRISKLSDSLSMTGFIHKAFGKLSSGQKQRSLIASALIHDPDILIMDEITAELDVIGSNYIMNLLKDECLKNRTIIFSTHIISEAEYICDRIAFMHEGKLKDFDSPENIKTKRNEIDLTSAFLSTIDLGKRAA